MIVEIVSQSQQTLNICTQLLNSLHKDDPSNSFRSFFRLFFLIIKFVSIANHAQSHDIFKRYFNIDKTSDQPLKVILYIFKSETKDLGKISPHLLSLQRKGRSITCWPFQIKSCVPFLQQKSNFKSHDVFLNLTTSVNRADYGVLSLVNIVR